MATHTWKSSASGSISDASNYTDGQVFAAGDTLVVQNGSPSFSGAGGHPAPLTTGTYVFLAGATPSLTNAVLDASTTLDDAGAGTLAVQTVGQLVNDGTILVASGQIVAAQLILMTEGRSNVGITNNGQIVLDAGRIQIFADAPANFVNSATGTIAIKNNGSFDFNGGFYFVGDQDTFRNDGLISVSGTSAVGADFSMGVAYSGNGTVSVTGGITPNQYQTQAEFDGPASGTFDVASGELLFNPSAAVTGTINFDDDGGVLDLAVPQIIKANANVAIGTFRAAINGFQAGDQIFLDADAAYQSYAYDQGSHTLSLYSAPGLKGAVVARLTLEGTYTTADFQLQTTSLYNTLIPSNPAAVLITTTSTANAQSQPAAVVPPTTLSVPAGGTLAGDNGSHTILASGSATISTGTGANTVFLGGGANLVTAHGSDFIVSSTGVDTVFAGSNVVAYGGSTGQLTVANGLIGSTVVGGGASMTVYGSSGGGDLIYGGTGNTEFVGGAGSSTFLGGAGQALVYGGAGGGYVYDGPGGGHVFGADAATTIVGGAGATTITAGNGNSVFLVGSVANVVVAGGGNMTLTGGVSSGNNTIFAGSGADQLAGGSGNDLFVAGAGSATMTGGGGANTYEFVNGHAGGNVVIMDFRPGTDHLSLQGYGSNAGPAALQTSAGPLSLLLPDGTKVVLSGVTLTPGLFS